MLALGHLRDQLLHDHTEHGPRREAQQVGKGRHDLPGGEQRQHGPDGLHDAGEHTVHESPALFHALGPERQGDDGPLGEILNGDAEGQRQRARRCDVRAA